jgi:hypothetical protein
MFNYICRPVTPVPDYLVVNATVPAATTFYAGEVILVNTLDASISGNLSVYASTQPATANLGKQMAVIINGGFEELSDGRRPEGQPDFTQYTYSAGTVFTAIILTSAMRFEISNDSVNLNSLTPTAGQVLYPVNAANTLTLGTTVPAGTYSSLSVLAPKYFRLGGQFGAQFASTMVVVVNVPTPAT